MDKYSFDKREAVSVENLGKISCRILQVSVIHRRFCVSWYVAMPLHTNPENVVFSTGGKGCGKAEKPRN